VRHNTCTITVLVVRVEVSSFVIEWSVDDLLRMIDLSFSGVFILCDHFGFNNTSTKLWVWTSDEIVRGTLVVYRDTLIRSRWLREQMWTIGSAWSTWRVHLHPVCRHQHQLLEAENVALVRRSLCTHRNQRLQTWLYVVIGGRCKRHDVDDTQPSVVTSNTAEHEGHCCRSYITELDLGEPALQQTHAFQFHVDIQQNTGIRVDITRERFPLRQFGVEWDRCWPSSTMCAGDNHRSQEGRHSRLARVSTRSSRCSCCRTRSAFLRQELPPRFRVVQVNGVCLFSLRYLLTFYDTFGGFVNWKLITYMCLYEFLTVLVVVVLVLPCSLK